MTITSAEKRHKQNLRRRLRNRAAISQVKSSIKKVEAALAARKLDEAQNELGKALSFIDKTADKGIMHKNNAARKKSRLTLLFNKVSSQPEPVMEEKAKLPKRTTTKKKKPAA